MKHNRTPFILAILLASLIPACCQSGAAGSAPDEISGLVHVNQIGYTPGMAKIALVPRPGTFTFEVVDTATNQAAFQGVTVPQSAPDKAAAQTVSAADFSALTAPGRYVVRVQGFGRSYPFVIDNHAYTALRDALLKMLYFQRAGVDLSEAYAGTWQRTKGHTAKSRLFDNPALELDIPGGWYDAGDYGRYTVPAAVTVADLFLAYEAAPELFGDTGGIPESGNGVPDILDECRWALDWLLLMQDPATGGAYHKQSTADFPGMVMPKYDRAPLFILPVSPTATADLAAVMAAAARVFAGTDPAYAVRCRRAAEKAWQWLAAHPHAPQYHNPPANHTGEYGDSSDSDERAWAAVELFRLTGRKEYHNAAVLYLAGVKTAAMKESLFSWQYVLGYALLSYLALPENRREPEAFRAVADFLRGSAEYRTALALSGYGCGLEEDEFVWGSNLPVGNLAKLFRAVMRADGAQPDIKIASENLVHYLLGRNPLDQCYVTGFGGRPVLHPHHRPSAADRIPEPVPGMVAGGPDRNLDDDAARRSLAGRPPMLCYVDDVNSYSTNEVTTYWNSSALFAVVWAEKLSQAR